MTFLDRWWSACRECAPYVQRWQWRALADRALDIRWIRDPAGARDEHLLRGELIATWIQLERQLTGVSRPGRGAAA